MRAATIFRSRGGGRRGRGRGGLEGSEGWSDTSASTITNRFPIASLARNPLAQAPSKPVFMYINSPGGLVTAGLAIYDTMQYIQPDCHTICMGQAASMGSLLLAGGAPGCR